MVRLFVGSFLKEDEAARIDQFGTSNQERMSAMTGASLRFVSTANLHITWVFLGEVAEDRVPAVQEQLRREVEFLKTGTGVETGALALERSERKYPPGGLGKKINIDVEYDYIEAWPKIQAGRVMVATPTVVPEAMFQIGLSLRQAMSGLGKVDQDEPRNLVFRPHLTIVRLSKPDNFGDGKLLAALSEVLPIRQRIDSIHLIKSHFGQSPGDYEIISSVR